MSESHEDWFSRVTGAGQEVLRYPGPTTRCPMLLTGVQPATLKSLETLGWEDKLETADLEKHMDYLRGRQFLALPHPLEATAWESGFVPETHGLPTNELESRILPLLPQLSHMVAASRQPPTAGQKDPSRSVLLDLKPSLNWQLPATVLDLGNDIAKKPNR